MKNQNLYKLMVLLIILAAVYVFSRPPPSMVDVNEESNASGIEPGHMVIVERVQFNWRDFRYNQ